MMMLDLLLINITGQVFVRTLGDHQWQQ